MHSIPHQIWAPPTPFSPVLTVTSVVSVGERGPGCIISPPMGAPRATFITMWLLQMTSWLLEGGDMTFDKQNMTGRGAHGLMLAVKLKGEKVGWVQMLWGVWGDCGADEHTTNNQPSNFCTGLCNLFWIRSTTSCVLRRNKRQGREMWRPSGWKIQQMSFLYLHVWWNPRQETFKIAAERKGRIPDVLASSNRPSKCYSMP